jgi:hypothetical protein
MCPTQVRRLHDAFHQPFRKYLRPLALGPVSPGGVGGMNGNRQLAAPPSAPLALQDRSAPSAPGSSHPVINPSARPPLFAISTMRPPGGGAWGPAPITSGGRGGSGGGDVSGRGGGAAGGGGGSAVSGSGWGGGAESGAGAAVGGPASRPSVGDWEQGKKNPAGQSLTRIDLRAGIVANTNNYKEGNTLLKPISGIGATQERDVTAHYEGWGGPGRTAGDGGGSNGIDGYGGMDGTSIDPVLTQLQGTMQMPADMEDGLYSDFDDI